MDHYGIEYEEGDFTPDILTEKTARAFVEAGFKKEYDHHMGNVEDIVDGFVFTQFNEGFASSITLGGIEYVNTSSEQPLLSYFNPGSGWESIVEVELIPGDNMRGARVKKQKESFVLYNKERNALMFKMFPSQDNKRRIIEAAILKVVEYFKGKTGVEAEKKKLQTLMRTMTKTGDVKKQLPKVKKSIKKIEDTLKVEHAGELLRVKARSILQAKETIAMAIRTERAETAKIKAKYEGSLLMPNISRDMVKRKWIAFKQEGYLYFGKKIKVTPDRYTNGTRMAGKIDVPIEEIKGYLCAKIGNGQIHGATMFGELLGNWKIYLYHISISGAICLGDCGRGMTEIDITDTGAVMEWLGKVEEMMKIINTESTYGTDSQYHKALFRKWELEGHPSRAGDSTIDPHIDEYIKRGYIMGSMYKGTPDTEEIEPERPPSAYPELEGLDEFTG
ncbi:MAG: hypothetical protein KAS32_14245, partial [Candidatus Peribacteraceae bacterium]|nr:hypothetical protein [Candidatus Peribacteraceae bacterium]